MTHLLGRFTRLTDDAKAAKNIERALRESVVITIEPGSPAGRKQLRGIPCIANGVPGTAPGTNPLHALLEKERD